ncbi:MAG: SGNH/GDSL hydrolase family protein [Oscillospiraceae bacterium]
MKKFLAAALVCSMIVSVTACSNATESGSAVTSDNSVSSADNSSEVSSADNSSEVSVTSEATPDNTSSEEIEEIPYVLGGELTPTMIANSRYNVGNQVRLANVIKKLRAGGEVTVAYLGGSITQGSSAGDNLCYARLTTNWLEEQFPEAKINYVRAGIGATGSYIGVHRADRDVLSHDPDLVFIDFSVNDTTERTLTNKEAYESLLRKLWNYTSAPAVVTIAMTQQDGTSFQEYHGEIVKKYDIPMISYRNAILDVIDKGYIQWTDISDDNIHPNIPGHQVLTDLITNYLQSVIDNVDSITGEESNFDIADPVTKYENASVLTSENTTPASLGGFAVKSGLFGNFSEAWMIRSTEGEFTEDQAIVFDAECNNVGILYGKLTSNAGKAEIYVDDNLCATIDSDFSGGWGSYVEYMEVATDLGEGVHTIKIVPVSTGSAAAFYVSGIALS